MDGFTYDPTQLSLASKELANGSAAVEAELARLGGRIEPLRSAFQGKAADGFQALWKEWHDSHLSRNPLSGGSCYDLVGDDDLVFW